MSVQQPQPSRHHWRQLVRAKRRALSSEQQYQASCDLRDRLMANTAITHAQRIGLYLAQDGELDLTPLINALRNSGRDLYLPVLHPFAPGHLLFLEYTTTTPLRPNIFRIPEPQLDVRRVSPLTDLDVILCPLVAFDHHGNRLGMGGGFYDRTLARWHQQHAAKPLPIGIAHDCQRVAALPQEIWDVPLPLIVTPSASYQFPP